MNWKRPLIIAGAAVAAVLGGDLLLGMDVGAAPASTLDVQAGATADRSDETARLLDGASVGRTADGDDRYERKYDAEYDDHSLADGGDRPGWDDDDERHERDD